MTGLAVRQDFRRVTPLFSYFLTKILGVIERNDVMFSRSTHIEPKGEIMRETETRKPEGLTKSKNEPLKRKIYICVDT